MKGLRWTTLDDVIMIIHDCKHYVESRMIDAVKAEVK